MRHVAIEAVDQVARVTINRPEKCNAITLPTVAELEAAISMSSPASWQRRYPADAPQAARR